MSTRIIIQSVDHVNSFESLEIENVNTSDLMKNINISQDSLENFLTFYQTLYFQFKNHNVILWPPD